MVRALRRHGLAPLIIFTGQHPRLDLAGFGIGDCPAEHLECPGLQDPHAHAALVTKAVLARFLANPPQLLIVQGDTSSALGGAQAAKSAGIALAHVEAGLRSHDLKNPWPEEGFRRAIDGMADLLFAPTELSAANLRREGLRGRIAVTGNSGIDALFAVREGAGSPGAGASSEPCLLVTCHRRENWNAGVAGLSAALRTIASEGLARVEVVLHPNPTHSRRMRQMLIGAPSIVVRPPLGHQETIAAMLAARLVLSDSGGLQEEAAALGVPLLILRERTERPEAIACGSVELVGTEPKRIVEAVRRRLATPAGPEPALPFGDGQAGEMIAAIVQAWLEDRAAGPELALGRRSVG